MGLVRHRAQDDQEADASQAAGRKDRVAQKDARPHRENRCLGEADAERASELLRSLGQPPELVVVLQQTEAALARVAQAAQSNGTPRLGEVHQTRRPLLSANQDTPPFALSPLRRQNPREEPGALAAHAGIWCSEASCHSSGRKSRQQRSPVDAVAISSGGEGDRAVESLEVKAPDGWETGQIRSGGRAT